MLIAGKWIRFSAWSKGCIKGVFGLIYQIFECEDFCLFVHGCQGIWKLIVFVSEGVLVDSTEQNIHVILFVFEAFAGYILISEIVFVIAN